MNKKNTCFLICENEIPVTKEIRKKNRNKTIYILFLLLPLKTKEKKCYFPKKKHYLRKLLSRKRRTLKFLRNFVTLFLLEKKE